MSTKGQMTENQQGPFFGIIINTVLMRKKIPKKVGESTRLNTFNQTLEVYLSGALKRDLKFSGKVEPEKLLQAQTKLYIELYPSIKDE